MENITMIPTVNVTGGWETIMEGTARQELENAVLPGFLRAQRWFGGKGRRIEAVRCLEWCSLPPTNKRIFCVFLEVCFVDGKSDLYFLPLGVSSGEQAARLWESRQRWLIARLTGAEGDALLYDALADDDTCMSLITAIGSECEFATRCGRIRAFPTAAFSSLVGEDAQSLPVVRGPATSSNSLLFYGQRLMLKLFRHLEPGINPEFEIGRHLTEGHVFQRIPRVAGAIEYQRSRSEPITLAILQSFVVNQGDGWQHALIQLARYYQHAANSDVVFPDRRALLQLSESNPPPAAGEAIGGYLSAAGTLGQRTAQMHHALSADPNNPDFAPEPFTPQDAAALRASIHSRGETVLATLRDNLDQLPQDVALSARQLLERIKVDGRRMNHDCLLSSFIRRPSSFKIRCHGDYHLGQVLRVEDDYAIIDFEGEPVQTVAERRAKQSPLKDVAGMMRSYHYAAYAGLFAFTQEQPDDFGRLVPWAELWSQWVSAAFLREYCAAAKGAVFLPADLASLTDLLDAFMLDKAYYELNYELNNRPDWVRIPLCGILALVSEPAL
jgi:maltose alpha-D-glucosyltransferase/alpha-amylase